MKKLALIVSLALTAAACGTSDPVAPGKDMAVAKDGGSGDMAMALGAGKVGAVCTAATDCGEGNAPTCLKMFPGGYCSSKCTKDTDCGTGVCGDVGASSKYCLTPCTKASDCRSGGMYACWTDGTCFPNDAFNCDPTANNGTCTVAMAGGPGGCLRYGIGAGKNGICSPTCAIGTGTCPPDSMGGAAHCIVQDERYDSMGMATGDKFVGGQCNSIVSMPGPAANEALCQYPDGMGGMGFYTDVCNDGYNCYLKGMAPAGMGYDANGDNKCHKFCTIGVASADGGVSVPDGGTVASSTCGTGTCHNVWGTGKFGLCY